MESKDLKVRPETHDGRKTEKEEPTPKGESHTNIDVETTGAHILSLSIPAKSPDRSDGGPSMPHALEGMDINVPLFICAEPGMGKSYVAGWIMRHAKSSGWSVNQFSLEEYDRDKTSRRVTRICHDMIRRIEQGNHVLLVIDGITPGDEQECANEARALMRFQEEGGRSVICMRPESEQLTEAVLMSTCLRTEDLLFRYRRTSDPEYELTGGIPALVSALSRDGETGRSAMLGTNYLAALDDLLGKTIRPELPLEDQRLRLAAVLLGSGTMDELAEVSGRCDIEQLVWLDRDVPLIDVDIVTRRFSVHGLSAMHVVSMCLNTLQRHAASNPDVVTRACAVLARRGSVRRSATLCALCPSEQDFAMTGTTWGVAYIEAGEVTVVREALKTSQALGRRLDVRGRLSELALASIVGSLKQLGEADEAARSLGLSSHQEQRLYQHVCLLRSCRELWRNPRKAQDGPAVAHDDRVQDRIIIVLELVLLEHRHADAGLDLHMAVGGVLRPRQDFQQGGLSRAVGPDDAVAVSGVELEIGVFEEHAAPVLHAQVGNSDHQIILNQKIFSIIACFSGKINSFLWKAEKYAKGT